MGLYEEEVARRQQLAQEIEAAGLEGLSGHPDAAQVLAGESGAPGAMRGDMYGPTPRSLTTSQPSSVSTPESDASNMGAFYGWDKDPSLGGLGLATRRSPVAMPSQTSSLGDVLARDLFPGENLGWWAKQNLEWAARDHPQTLFQRETLAQRLLQQRLQKEQKDEDQALSVWKDQHLPLATKKKLSQTMSQRGNVLAGNLARLADEQAVAELETLTPFLPQGKLEELTQLMRQPNADLAPVEQWLEHARQKKKATQEARFKSERFAELLQQHQTSPFSPDSPEFDELKTMVGERKKRDEEARKLQLDIESLRGEVAFKQHAPKEVASGLLNDQGQVFTDVYNPQTKQTERTVGTPLQRTQEIPTGVKTTAMKTIDAVKNIRGTIDQLRSVLVDPQTGKKRDDAIGLIGSLKGLVYGASAQSDAFAGWLRGSAAAISEHAASTGSSFKANRLFDPAVSKAEMLAFVLAYQQVLVNSDDGRVSDPDFENAVKSLGIGKKLTGVDDILTRLDTLTDIVNRREKIANERLQRDTEQKPKFQTIEEYKKARGIQ